MSYKKQNDSGSNPAVSVCAKQKATMASIKLSGVTRFEDVDDRLKYIHLKSGGWISAYCYEIVGDEVYFQAIPWTL
jgi:hypothetical protein